MSSLRHNIVYHLYLRARAMLVCALIYNPEVLVFDEPPSALNLETRKDFFDLIKRLNICYDFFCNFTRNSAIIKTSVVGIFVLYVKPKMKYSVNFRCIHLYAQYCRIYRRTTGRAGARAK